MPALAEDRRSARRRAGRRPCGRGRRAARRGRRRSVAAAAWASSSGPGGAGQRRPHRPRRPARRRAAARSAAPPSYAGPGRSAAARSGVGRRGRRRRRCFSVVACRARDRQPQHVGAGAGVAGGDQLGEPGHRRGQHRLGADRPAQRRQPALVVAARHPLEHEAVDVLAGEADLDPGARPRPRRAAWPGRGSRRAGRGGPAARRPAPARPAARAPGRPAAGAFARPAACALAARARARTSSGISASWPASSCSSSLTGPVSQPPPSGSQPLSPRLWTGAWMVAMSGADLERLHATSATSAACPSPVVAGPRAGAGAGRLAHPARRGRRRPLRGLRRGRRRRPARRAARRRRTRTRSPGTRPTAGAVDRRRPGAERDPSAERDLADLYRGSLDRNVRQVAAAVRAFLDAPPGPVVVHCAARQGPDRDARRAAARDGGRPAGGGGGRLRGQRRAARHRGDPGRASTRTPGGGPRSTPGRTRRR